ncbi:MAG: peptidoglycan editing factor PgeF [Tannerellaceae bacterium]|nr:peptidoglycan editing factor PgeF [Tannerellaceae bacterium]
MKKIQTSNQIEMLQFPRLGRDCNIFHLVTTRQGGVSQGAYATMNPGEYAGDDPEAVRKNRELLCEALAIPPDRLVTPYQIHGSAIVAVSEDYFSLSPENRKQALEGVDALITRLPEVCIGVSTADCVPVLLWDPGRKVVAAVHAGWRGTVQRIVYKTVIRMTELYGSDPLHIQAGIGPSIDLQAFEVGDEVAGAFREAGYSLPETGFRHPATGKAHIDLWEVNRLQLTEAGVLPVHIEIAGMCTWQHPELFFSARRLGIQSGRILSAIMIRK